MGLPFEPELVESALARFKAALTPDIDVVDAIQHPERTPGKFRKHVFDFNDGIRMIASMDRWPAGQRKLHLSFSFDPSPHHTPGIPTAAWFMSRVNELCWQFGGSLPVEHHRTPGAVHFWFEPPRKE